MSRLLILAFNASETALATGFAQKLGLSFDVLQLTDSAGATNAEKLFLASLAEVPTADSVAQSIAEFAKNYTHIAAVSSMRSKDVLARIAGILDAGMVTDVVGAESESVFHRPVFAGSVVAKVEVLSTPVCITLRPANFPSADAATPTSTESVALNVSPASERRSTTSRGGSRPDLSQAKIVVSGGRPLKDAETFEKVVGGFADALGAAVGATRAAVDSGIAPNELQVGQTGKVVAPDLYIAAGISGSTQHMAGIKDSKLIVAINKDPDAPIFDQADLGIVGDLYEILPALQAELGK